MKNKILSFVILLILVVFSAGCGESTPKEPEFRSHIVRHCDENGKLHWYYHMDAYECPGLEMDLCDHCDYKKSYKNYVKYYDNGETVYGR